MQGWVLSLVTYSEPVVSLIALALIIRSGSLKKFGSLALFLGTHLAVTCACLLYAQLYDRGIVYHFVYQTYFYTYWFSLGLESILSMVVIYTVFALAMLPLQGLQRLGVVVFRWAGAISIAIAAGVAVNTQGSGHGWLVCLLQLQQTSSILTLCLMLFVCFAIRPLGLSFTTRIFGVTFGMGVIAATNLIVSAWTAHSPNMQSEASIANGAAVCTALIIWSFYFGLPEKKQRMLVIPTTSPFLHWNQISEALGDEPGVVAIGGLSPDVFAPAELEMMFRASAKMAALNQAEDDARNAEEEPHSLTA